MRQLRRVRERLQSHLSQIEIDFFNSIYEDSDEAKSNWNSVQTASNETYFDPELHHATSWLEDPDAGPHALPLYFLSKYIRQRVQVFYRRM